jgi:hypothetical protein
MGRLSAEQKNLWKKNLAECNAAWIVCGIDFSLPASERLLGMTGLIDWHLHGQVSRLIAENQLSPGEFCLVPGAGKNFLFCQLKEKSAPLVQRLRAMHAEEIAVASSTFPEDFLADLKENLKKAGIRWSKLET